MSIERRTKYPEFPAALFIPPYLFFLWHPFSRDLKSCGSLVRHVTATCKTHLRFHAASLIYTHTVSHSSAMTGIFHPWRWLPDVRIFHRHRDAEYSNTHSQRILLAVCYLGSLRALLPLTFAACVGDKGRRNLHDPFAFALRAGNLPLFILGKSLKQRKLMLTALGFTLIFVSRHVVPPLLSYNSIELNHFLQGDFSIFCIFRGCPMKNPASSGVSLSMQFILL